MFDFFLNLPNELAIFLIAMVPIGELRVSIPIAINNYEMTIMSAYFWSVLGNIVPILFIVFFLESTSEYLSHRIYYFNRFFEWLFERTRRKHSKRFERYEELALFLFVAIPLPITGAWSGAVAAFVFGIPPKKAIPFIILGVLVSGIIVTLITQGINFVI